MTGREQRQDRDLIKLLSSYQAPLPVNLLQHEARQCAAAAAGARKETLTTARFRDYTGFSILGTLAKRYVKPEYLMLKTHMFEMMIFYNYLNVNMSFKISICSGVLRCSGCADVSLRLSYTSCRH